MIHECQASFKICIRTKKGFQNNDDGWVLHIPECWLGSDGLKTLKKFRPQIFFPESWEWLKTISHPYKLILILSILNVRLTISWRSHREKFAKKFLNTVYRIYINCIFSWQKIYIPILSIQYIHVIQFNSVLRQVYKYKYFGLIE